MQETNAMQETNVADEQDILLTAEDLPTPTAELATASKDGNDGGEVDGSSDFI